MSLHPFRWCPGVRQRLLHVCSISHLNLSLRLCLRLRVLLLRVFVLLVFVLLQLRVLLPRLVGAEQRAAPPAYRVRRPPR